MRRQEKDFFEKLGYKLIELSPCNKTYAEISSHVDIFACQINSTIFVEKSKFDVISSQIEPSKVKVSDRSIRNSEKIIQKM